MGIAEQREEREVLDSIFPDEITDVSDAAYRVSILLDITYNDDEEHDPVTINLSVSYPEAYPDVAPNLDISAPPNGPRNALLDVSEDRSRLLEALAPTIEETIGVAMIFTLVMTLKDAAETLIADRQRLIQAAKDVEAQKAEEEENRKFHGTAVTRESFLKWREKFRYELAEKERKEREDTEADEKKKRGRLEEKKLTGKQLWEHGLVGKVPEDEELEREDAATGLDKLSVEM